MNVLPHTEWYKCEMFVWSGGLAPGLIIVILLTAEKRGKARQREAKRGKAAAFNWRPKERWRQKAQIKQMAESGLDRWPVVIDFEWKRTAAGITHLGLSVWGPHRSLHPSFQLEVHAHRGATCEWPMSYFRVSTSNPFVAILKVQSEYWPGPWSLPLVLLWTSFTGVKMSNTILWVSSTFSPCFFVSICSKKTLRVQPTSLRQDWQGGHCNPKGLFHPFTCWASTLM